MTKASDYLSKFGRIRKPIVSTGILGLDIQLGKGFALGGMYGLGSPEGSGKSTLMLQMSKHFIDVHNLNVTYLDAEQGVTDELMESLGMLEYPTTRFNLVQDVVTFTELHEYTNNLIEAKKEGSSVYHILIIDSLNAIASQTIIESDIEARKIAPYAKPITEYITSVRGRLGVAKIGCVVIGQSGQNIGGSQWEPDTYVKLPKKVQHAVDAMITIEHKNTKSSQMWTTMNTPSGPQPISYGYWGKMWTLKNKKGLPSLKIPMPVIFGKGFDNILFVENTLLLNNLVKKYGDKYTLLYKDNEKFTSEKDFLNYIENNYDEIVQYLKENGYYDLSNPYRLINSCSDNKALASYEVASDEESAIDGTSSIYEDKHTEETAVIDTTI